MRAIIARGKETAFHKDPGGVRLDRGRECNYCTRQTTYVAAIVGPGEQGDVWFLNPCHQGRLFLAIDFSFCLGARPEILPRCALLADAPWPGRCSAGRPRAKESRTGVTRTKTGRPREVRVLPLICTCSPRITESGGGSAQGLNTSWTQQMTRAPEVTFLVMDKGLEAFFHA